jgi:hypothetical protein
MASITYGGAVPNKGVNLTCVGNTQLDVGDFVEIMGAYEVDLPTARASLSIAGYIIVANAAAGEDVTVASRFNSVETFTAGGIIAAGNPVVIGTNGRVYAYDPSSSPGSADDCCAIIGIALTAAAAAGSLDVGVL